MEPEVRIVSKGTGPETTVYVNGAPVHTVTKVEWIIVPDALATARITFEHVAGDVVGQMEDPS